MTPEDQPGTVGGPVEVDGIGFEKGGLVVFNEEGGVVDYSKG